MEQGTSATEIDTLGDFIIVVTEFHILLLDVVSSHMREIPMSHLDIKSLSITGVDFWGSYLFFSTGYCVLVLLTLAGDGVVKMWDARSWRLVKTLTGGHNNKAITSLYQFHVILSLPHH